jgi:hypothetical protein
MGLASKIKLQINTPAQPPNHNAPAYMTPPPNPSAPPYMPPPPMAAPVTQPRPTSSQQNCGQPQFQQQNYPYGKPQSSQYQQQNSSHSYGGSYTASPQISSQMYQGSGLEQKLRTIIAANKLDAFYPPARFQAVLQKVQSIDFNGIAARWNISRELAIDLAPLVLYDIVFYCDDSGSMAFEENGERIDDLKYILSRVSEIATLFDDDGIVVRFMNSNNNGDGIRNASEVESLLSRIQFNGTTPLGTMLDRKIIQPFVIAQVNTGMAKPILTIAITDGEPSEPRNTLMQVVYRTKEFLSRTQYGPGAFALQIAQVGKDARAQRFLAELDNDPFIGSMIDCTSYYEMEAEEFMRKGVTLTPELWLLKMCVGSIDPSYDSKDE